VRLASIWGWCAGVVESIPGGMYWPAAALAVLLLGFAVVYGSVVQARLDAGRERKAPGQDQ
jgi:hypothetical protein